VDINAFSCLFADHDEEMDKDLESINFSKNFAALSKKRTLTRRSAKSGNQPEITQVKHVPGNQANDVALLKIALMKTENPDDEDGQMCSSLDLAAMERTPVLERFFQIYDGQKVKEEIDEESPLVAPKPASPSGQVSPAEKTDNLLDTLTDSQNLDE